MKSPVYIDVTVEPGFQQIAHARRPLIVRRPAFLIECPLNYRFRQVQVVGIRFEHEEQLATPAGVPADIFAELLPSTVLPMLCAGDEVSMVFANPKDAPLACFRLWFGELHELRKLRNPQPECATPGKEHVWRSEESMFTRSCSCPDCGAKWVSDPL